MLDHHCLCVESVLTIIDECSAFHPDHSRCGRIGIGRHSKVHCVLCDQFEAVLTAIHLRKVERTLWNPINTIYC